MKGMFDCFFNRFLMISISMLFSQAWRARADAEIKALRNDQVGESYELGGAWILETWWEKSSWGAKKNKKHPIQNHFSRPKHGEIIEVSVAMKLRWNWHEHLKDLATLRSSRVYGSDSVHFPNCRWDWNFMSGKVRDRHKTCPGRDGFRPLVLIKVDPFMSQTWFFFPAVQKLEQVRLEEAGRKTAKTLGKSTSSSRTVWYLDSRKTKGNQHWGTLGWEHLNSSKNI